MKEEEKRKQELNDEELNDVAGGGIVPINTHFK